MKRKIDQLIQWRHSPLAFLLLIFVVSQLYLASVHSFPTTRIETDGIGYMQHASGDLFLAEPYHGPAYPWMIRLIHNVTGFPLFVSAQTVSILAGLLLICAAFRVFSLSDDRQTAYRAVVLMAFMPVVLQYSNMIMSDILASALLWTTILILIKNEPPNFRQLIFAGIIAGFAYLTRYIYIFLVFIPPCLLLNRHNIKSSLCALSGFYTGFCLAILPWAAFLGYTKGNPFWNHNHLNIAFKMYRNGQGWTVFPSVEQFPDIASVVLSDPVLFIKSWINTLGSIPLTASELIPTVGVYLGTIGLLLWISKPSVRKVIIATVLFCYILLIALVWIDHRFLLPLAPFVALCVSRAIKAIPVRIVFSPALFPSFSRWKIPLRFPAMTVTLLFILVASSGLPSWFKDRQADEYIQVINWLKNMQVDKDTTIMASKPHIPFFSGTTGIGFGNYNLHNKDISSLPATLDHVQPDYFIYDERYALRSFPKLLRLLRTNAGTQVECLRPVLIIQSPKRLIVYEYTGKETDTR